MNKITLIGTFRCGKSTLLESLRGSLSSGYHLIPEVARPLLEKNPSLETDPNFQNILFEEQKRLETKELATNAETIICDRGAIDIIAYASYFGQNINPEWETWARTYHKVFLLNKDDISFTQEIIDNDPQYAPGRDWIKFREDIHLSMLETLNRLTIPHELLSGTVEDRIIRLRREIEMNLRSSEGGYLRFRGKERW